MKTYETDGPKGIFVMYLCNCVPMADVKQVDGKTIITVPDEDDTLLKEELEERGYTFKLVEEKP